jgi:glutaredoxin 3
MGAYPLLLNREGGRMGTCSQLLNTEPFKYLQLGVTELSEEIRRVLITMRNVRGPILLTLLIIAVSTLVPVAHSQERANDEKTFEPSYVVVLKNGRQIPARTKPISAFGKLRYMEPGGTNRVLPISEVDIEKTRAANSQAATQKRGGTLSVGGELAGSDPSNPGDASRKTGTVEKTRDRTVKVYSATWCPYCNKLKKFLAENGISASITEVDKLPNAERERAQAEMRRLTGRVSYPTVVIGDSAVAGFSPQWILKSLER